MTTDEALASKVNALNAMNGELKECECAVCHNKGIVWYAEEGILRSRECRCMAERVSRSRLRRSGLSDLISAYTFGSYKTDTAATERVLRKARAYCEADSGWFLISGKPGSGKTHICTAICGQLIAKGKDTRYMLWREEAPRLKGLVNSRAEYDTIMTALKRAEVLYIDDFLKGNVTEADVNLAFELLNHRYNDRKKLTIISTERSIEQILSIDEAIGSRIYERSKGFLLKAPDENRRLR